MTVVLEHGCPLPPFLLANTFKMAKIIIRQLRLPLRVTQGKSMLFSLLRGLKCRQVGQIQINLSINGTATTPVASGPDASFVASVEDLGTGNFKINFKEPAKLAPFVTGLVSLTADATIQVTAVTVNSVTVLAKSVAASPAAKDVDFNIQLQWADQLAYYF